MQRKFILFLMFLLSISNNAFSLDIRKSGAFVREASNLSPNVASLSDIVVEQPNEAFLPTQDSVINYENISVSDVALFTPEVEQVEQNIVKSEVKTPIKKERKLVSNLKSSDFERKQTRKSNPTSRARSVKQLDKFADIIVPEGEEVLVSTSEPTFKIENILSTKPFENKVEQNVASTEISAPKSVSNNEIDNNPFGVIISKTKVAPTNDTKDIAKSSPFLRAFSAIKPEAKKSNSSTKKVPAKKKASRVASSENIKKELHRAYLSGNQYLSAYEDDDEEDFEEDVDSEIDEDFEENEEEYVDDAGFKSQKNVKDALEGKGDKKPPVVEINSKDIKEKLQTAKKSIVAPSGPLKVGTREVLQMKIDFENGSSAISGESVNLIRSFAQIATEQPTNSIEITIPEGVMNSPNMKKLTARRLSIVSNILRNSGVSDKQILPVLSNRDDDSFAFRIVNNDAYSKLRVSKGVDMFGEEENVKEYNIMKW